MKNPCPILVPTLMDEEVIVKHMKKHHATKANAWTTPASRKSVIPEPPMVQTIRKRLYTAYPKKGAAVICL